MRVPSLGRRYYPACSQCIYAPKISHARRPYPPAPPSRPPQLRACPLPTTSRCCPAWRFSSSRCGEYRGVFFQWTRTHFRGKRFKFLSVGCAGGLALLSFFPSTRGRHPAPHCSFPCLDPRLLLFAASLHLGPPAFPLPTPPHPRGLARRHRRSPSLSIWPGWTCVSA